MISEYSFKNKKGTIVTIPFDEVATTSGGATDGEYQTRIKLQDERHVTLKNEQAEEFESLYHAWFGKQIETLNALQPKPVDLDAL